jgi:hypothetical protein
MSFTTAAGSQWQQTFTLTNPDGTPINLTGLTWEFVIRPTVQDAAVPPLVSVTTTPTSQGSITVTPLTGIVTVTLTPAATTLLGKGQRPHALWSNPGTPTAITWVAGNFTTQLVANP